VRVITSGPDAWARPRPYRTGESGTGQLLRLSGNHDARHSDDLSTCVLGNDGTSDWHGPDPIVGPARAIWARRRDDRTDAELEGARVQLIGSRMLLC
jgi:hypothetical protein